MMAGRGDNPKETHRLNEIILIEEMNHLHRNGIILMFNVCCYIMHVPT
jgi:hypothetical protein